MKVRQLTGLAVIALLLAACASTPTVDPVEMATKAKLTSVVNSSSRPAASVARNQYRNPVETLMFFGLRDDMTVVEISPGGGAWYTEVLAPMMRDNGTFYAAGYDPASENEYVMRNAIKFNEKMIANPEMYDKVEQSIFSVPDNMQPAPDGSADMVLTFRSFHGWAGRGNHQAAMDAMYKALKPGGILGLVQHRMNEDRVIAEDEKIGSLGYIKPSLVIETAEKAGFELVESSEINANPLDTKNHPNGVWTLKPGNNYKDLPEGTDTSVFAAIGESDRMTLKFVKPK